MSGSCLQTAITFLLELHGMGAPFTEAIANLVNNFDEPMKLAVPELVQGIGAA